MSAPWTDRPAAAASSMRWTLPREKLQVAAKSLCRLESCDGGAGDACRALSAAALAAGLPSLLNDVRRVLLAVHPQQAEAAVAIMQELALETESAGPSTTMPRVLAALQQLPVVGASHNVAADLENEAAALILQAWQALCSSAAVKQ